MNTNSVDSNSSATTDVSSAASAIQKMSLEYASPKGGSPRCARLCWSNFGVYDTQPYALTENEEPKTPMGKRGLDSPLTNPKRQK